MDYLFVRHLHVSCAALSITLFLVRGTCQTAGWPWRQWRWLRIAPHLVDTVLLGAAISLACWSQQFPLAQNWLSAKVVALLVYIGLGSLALRPGASRAVQCSAFLGALLTVAYIVGVALTRSASLGLI
ncbi:MAG: SirB2 family protein [Comamonadaceae bacterium]